MRRARCNVNRLQDAFSTCAHTTRPTTAAMSVCSDTGEPVWAINTHVTDSVAQDALTTTAHTTRCRTAAVAVAVCKEKRRLDMMCGLCVPTSTCSPGQAGVACALPGALSHSASLTAISAGPRDWQEAPPILPPSQCQAAVVNVTLLLRGAQHKSRYKCQTRIRSTARHPE